MVNTEERGERRGGGISWKRGRGKARGGAMEKKMRIKRRKGERK